MLSSDQSFQQPSDPVPGTLEAAKAIVKRISAPFEIYAPDLLRIAVKTSGKPPQPFELNKAQLYVHSRLEKQLEEKKMVRALILKGRQQGISTYVGGRFFRRQHALSNTNIYILSHEQESATTLFNIAKRFHRYLPDDLKPVLGKSGSKQLTFPVMDCSYSVGTAGAKETGRSKTIQLFHGSEVAFWPNAQTHLAGALQTVGDIPGTEIILESTANGVGNKFHKMWLDAERGIGPYIAIFVPWYWQEEYRSEPPAGWQPVDEELRYARVYKLSRQQAYWMHLKNIAFGGAVGKIHWQFRQEYPGNAEEAFQTSSTNSLIKSDLVIKARKSTHVVATRDDSKVMGVDIARNVQAGDATEFIDRQGRVAGKLVFEQMRTDNTMAIVRRIVELINKHDFDMVFVDLGGVGAGVYDRLRELGWGPRVRGVNFGSAATDEEKYKNKRGEMYGEMAEWFELEGGVSVPDDDELQRHVCAVGYKEDETQRKILQKKEEIRKEHGFSPDKADALALTFAETVITRHVAAAASRFGSGTPRNSGTSWMAD